MPLETTAHETAASGTEGFVRVGKFMNCLCRKDILRGGEGPSYNLLAELGTEASRKEVREAENAACVGGMRSPHRSVARSPGLREVGKKLRNILTTILDRFPEFEETLELLRLEPGHELRQDASAFKSVSRTSAAAHAARCAIASTFGNPTLERLRSCGMPRSIKARFWSGCDLKQIGRAHV